jgi:hypothetical protein
VRADIVAALGEKGAAQANGTVQANGDPPTTLVAGSAPGESGVAVFCHRFYGGMHFRNSPPHHSSASRCRRPVLNSAWR